MHRNDVHLPHRVNLFRVPPHRLGMPRRPHAEPFVSRQGRAKKTKYISGCAGSRLWSCTLTHAPPNVTPRLSAGTRLPIDDYQTLAEEWRVGFAKPPRTPVRPICNSHLLPYLSWVRGASTPFTLALLSAITLARETIGAHLHATYPLDFLYIPFLNSLSPKCLRRNSSLPNRQTSKSSNDQTISIPSCLEISSKAGDLTSPGTHAANPMRLGNGTSPHPTQRPHSRWVDGETCPIH